MWNRKTIKRAHLIGVGGIHVSAVAKLLRHEGIIVSGSDRHASEITDELSAQGCTILLQQDENNVPDGTDIVIYSSAVPETNPERREADRRGIPSYNSHAFLGLWFAGREQIVIAGTHGKSTTTAMVGICLIEAGRDPSIVVGTKVSSLPEKNIRFGGSNVVVLEGDEYDRHFLAFTPTYLLINNLELDHVDQYPDLEALFRVFGMLIQRVREGGMIIANGDEENVRTLLERERETIRDRKIRVCWFGVNPSNEWRVRRQEGGKGTQHFTVIDPTGGTSVYQLQIPGKMNVMNAAGCIVLCEALALDRAMIFSALETFPGVWRRCEKIGEKNGTIILSDYGHHPTAVARTVEAIKEFYPNRRLILCFQPHHRNRTRHLFLDFVSSFDAADELLLVEIFDVAGREQAEDETISSQDLCEAVRRHDADGGIHRSVEYAANPSDALKTLKAWMKPTDVIVVMGAGDLYLIAPQLLV